MKTRTYFIAMLLLSGIFSLQTKANIKLSQKAAQIELVDQIEEVVNKVPFDLYFDKDEITKVNIFVRIDQDCKITEIEVDGENEALINYLKLKLEKEELKVDDALAGVKCKVPVHFECRD